MCSVPSHTTHASLARTLAPIISRFSSFCARAFAGHFAWTDNAINFTRDCAGDDLRSHRLSRELSGGAVSAAHGARVSDGVWGGAWAVDDVLAPGSSSKQAFSFYSMMT